MSANPQNAPECFVDDPLREEAYDFAIAQLDAIPEAVDAALDVLLPGNWRLRMHDLIEAAELERLEKARG